MRKILQFKENYSLRHPKDTKSIPEFFDKYTDKLKNLNSSFKQYDTGLQKLSNYLKKSLSNLEVENFDERETILNKIKAYLGELKGKNLLLGNEDTYMTYLNEKLKKEQKKEIKDLHN